MDLFLGTGNAWYCGADVGPGRALLVPGLVFGPFGKAPAPKGGKVPPPTRPAGFTSRAPGFKAPPGAGVGFQPLDPPPYPSAPPSSLCLSARSLP